MTFKKFGEYIELGPNAIKDANTVIPIISENVLDEMKKFASNLKRIAPKADDFLYFSAVMMHAAEAALVNEDGTPKLTSRGEKVQGSWDESGGTWRWKCNDSNVRPYKNSNGDIFPEKELVRAYKKWVGRPLCIDHKSNSVDHIRGIIVDTYYDYDLKRVIALCALDKQNYPDLAKKVSSGVSNSVSMGTAVGKAICFDCGQVARTEHDFCQHMRAKSCYGEINIDLSPIELSIVVNGADPQAKIKHIIAAANHLNNYVESKEKELEKLTKSATAESVSKIKMDLDEALDKLAKLEDSLKESKKDTNDSAFNQSHSSVAMPETEMEATDFSLAPPVQRYAEDAEPEKILTLLKSSIESKLSEMKKDLDKLANRFTSKNNEEEIMSGSKDNMNKQGYYQGAGGINEPTPGEKKYPVDPTNEKLRESGDKQMVGQGPFPDVGPIDGMHPSPDSADKDNELERKKMLARAESEQRALRRSATLQKAKESLGYFQGGGDVNEPTPGKPRYKVDPLQVDDRNKYDKQMVGQKPFPGVGPIDGMHPSPESADTSDELKRKELLQRAGLKARFMKAAKEDGSHDLGASAWEVFLGDKLLLTATVDEISNNRANELYAAIATEAFGKDLIGKVKANGADKTKSLFKGAQAPALPPAPAAGDSSVPPMGDDTGKDGDPKTTAMDLAEKVRDLSSDLVEAVRALTGEQAEMGGSSELGAADDSSGDSKVSTAALNNMRKELSGGLLVAIKEAVTGLNDHEQELKTIIAMYDKGLVTDVNKGFVNSVVEDALTATKSAVAESLNLLGAFAKYARGTQAVIKRAETEAELSKQADGEDMNQAKTSPDSDSLMAMIGDTHKELEEASHMVDDAADDDAALNQLLADDIEALQASDSTASADAAAHTTGMSDANKAAAVMTTDPNKAAELHKKNPDVPVELKADASTKEGRAALRNKLASEMKWNPVMYEFHPKGKATTHLDTKPSDDLAVVENIEEVHDAVMDVATQATPKIRQAADEIQKLIVEGKLDPKDLDILVANGVDPAAVKYWHELYNQAGSEGKEFANELVKEHSKAQLEEEMGLYRVKIARAYELAYEMVDRELLARDRGVISDQVDQIMKWNDEGFESMKKVIARHAPVMQKNAGSIPQVGLIGSGEVNSSSGSDDMATLLAAAFSKSSRRMF